MVVGGLGLLSTFFRQLSTSPGFGVAELLEIAFMLGILAMGYGLLTWASNREIGEDSGSDQGRRD